MRSKAEKVYRIAVVHPSHPVATLTETSFSAGVRAIFTELRLLGYVEGKNILIKRYSREGRAAHYPDLARDVVHGNPDVVIAIGNDLVLDFRAATTTIPIVGTFIAPVEAGIVSSLARPAGNITGVSGSVGLDLIEKRVQLLQQMVPHATRFWILQPLAMGNRWQAEWRESAWMHRSPTPLDPPINEAESRRAFAALARYGADGSW
jgi:putative tryptophan/tyrosine transport system substrate-binding protein